MATTSNNPTVLAAGSEVLDRLVDEISQKLQSGEPVDCEAYARQYPEYAEKLRRLIPSMQSLAELGQSLAPGIDESAAELSNSNPVRGLLGDFRIIREIGRGGMGIVYEAEQVSLGRRVALKVLPFAAMMDSKQLLRFKNEAHAAAQLHHQNIVPVYFVGNERGVHYYAMQFIEGETLAEVVRELRRTAGLHPEEENSRRDAAVAEKPENRSENSLRAPRLCVNDSAEAGQTTVLHPVAALSTERSIRPREFFRTVARLAIQAAEALDHAHQVGIIHGDVKPSNLLLAGHVGPVFRATFFPSGDRIATGGPLAQWRPRRNS